MTKPPKAENLSIHLRKEIVDEIISRGESLDKKKGSYAAMILEKWFAEGCPPVSESDRLMQIAKQSEKRDTKAAKRAS